ncbi:RING finger protein 122-like isoform X2 [Xyrauchen texanus]|uniref:RING finger protein 122-like isoform X2 n=1 Tax=Xyrauchen texanus TaxID=154827 RepID=UPI002242A648|nr:RING finger protein 122-like isoform X2 [Xyrauchen texanus]
MINFVLSYRFRHINCFNFSVYSEFLNFYGDCCQLDHTRPLDKCCGLAFIVWMLYFMSFFSNCMIYFPFHLNSKLRHQAQSERFGYREVILKGDPKKLNLHGTCAVCLEDFKVKDELGVLPCQHAFHRRCVVKWLEVRCVCPMCNKPVSGSTEKHQSIGTLPDELV